MRVLKVAVLIAFPANPEQPQGGVEAVAVNLVPALARRPELDVHVITLDSACPKLQLTRWKGATLHRLPGSGGPLIFYSTGKGRQQIHQYLTELTPDVVHAHDTYGIMVKGLDAPRVFTVHGFIHEDTRYAGGRGAWWRAKLWKAVETASWADQPHIVSISPYVRERLGGIAKGVIHDIENPIAAECFETPRQPRPGVIFCAASICQRKNTLGLVEALSRVRAAYPQARLRWAGRGTDAHYEKRVRDFIANHGLSAHVDLLGSISVEQVRRELSQASVFALISFEEGAPMGIAEAMAAGVPVVTSNRCGMPYMIREGESGFLVQPDNPDQVAERLLELLQNESMQARMGERARQFALERFHPEKVARRTLEVYRRAVTQG